MDGGQSDWEELSHGDVIARGDLHAGLEAWPGGLLSGLEEAPARLAHMGDGTVAMSGALPSGPIEVSLFSPGGVYHAVLQPLARKEDSVVYAAPRVWRRRNRRGAFRLGVSWPAEVTSVLLGAGDTGTPRPLELPVRVRVADVSPIGARLAGLDAPARARIRLRILLPARPVQPALSGRVVYRMSLATAPSGRVMFCGVQFTDADGPSERALVRRIMEEQRRILHRLRR